YGWRSGGYFTPDSRLLRRYISLSALLTAPNGIGLVGAGVLIAVDGAGFFALCFAANAADVDRPRMAMLTMTILFIGSTPPLGTGARQRLGVAGVRDRHPAAARPQPATKLRRRCSSQNSYSGGACA